MSDRQPKNFLLMVASATLITSVSVFFGIPVTPVGWLVPIVLSGLVVAFHARASHILRFVLWAPWIAYSSCSLVISHPPNAVIRSILMYCPLLVGIAASTYTVSEEDFRGVLKILRWTGILLLIVLMMRAGLGESDQLFFFAIESTTAVLLASIFAVHLLRTGSLASLVSFCAMALLPILSLSRAATVAFGIILPGVMAPISFVLRCTLALLVAFGALGLFYSSGFQEKTFSGQSADISNVISSGEDVNTSGRLKIWAALLDGVIKEPWLGHGANASEAVVEDVTATAEQVITHPHNDYLRIVFDYGFVGLSIYLITIVTQIYVIIRRARRAALFRSIILYGAATSFGSYLLLMTTDNVLMYAAYFGNLQYALIGFGLSQDNTSHLATGKAP